MATNPRDSRNAKASAPASTTTPVAIEVNTPISFDVNVKFSDTVSGVALVGRIFSFTDPKTNKPIPADLVYGRIDLKEGRTMKSASYFLGYELHPADSTYKGVLRLGDLDWLNFTNARTTIILPDNTTMLVSQYGDTFGTLQAFLNHVVTLKLKCVSAKDSEPFVRKEDNTTFTVKVYTYQVL